MCLSVPAGKSSSFGCSLQYMETKRDKGEQKALKIMKANGDKVVTCNVFLINPKFKHFLKKLIPISYFRRTA